MILRNERGSLLLETAASLPLLVGALLLNLELIRRAQLDLLLHHGAFLAVRARVLGKGRLTAERTARHLTGPWKATYQEEWGLVRLHARYPQLWAFPYRGYTKHHFESTRRCRFPIASAY